LNGCRTKITLQGPGLKNYLLSTTMFSKWRSWNSIKARAFDY